MNEQVNISPESHAYAGNLLHNLDVWRKITSDPWVLETVSGYHLEFESLPVQSVLPRPAPFSEGEKQLIAEEITKLLTKGAIRKVSSCPYEFISNIFLVPKKTGDLRPVINLKPLNQFVQRIHFKMENIQMAMNFVSLGDYMVSLDLKDAYFSVPIFRPHCKYLRFIWRDQRYEFTCLPFGYSLAPRVFAKIFKPVVAQLRLNDLRIAIFLDDILLVASSFAECMEQLSLLRKLLESIGFVINDAKSQLQPTTRICFLGFIIDSISMELLLPEDKLQKIISACLNLLSKNNPSVREVAHVTGLLVSAFPAVNYLNLYYRSIELCKSQALSENLDFDQAIILSPQAKSDLHWIINNLAKFNGCFFGERPIDIYIECDASLAGWGASCGGQSANGQWSILEAHNHINYLELLAALYALQAFVPNLRDVHVRLKLDNSTAVAYVNKMGGIKSPSLNSLSRTLWKWCIERNIIISAQHIPGKENLVADSLSREFSSNLEWSVDNDIFNQISNMTFVPDIDLFASRLNAKTDCFVSWHPEPGAMAVDAFSISWANLKCYAFPPFSLLTKVLAKIRNDKALVLLIAPVWTTQNWYPLLLQLAVEQPIILPQKDNLLTLPHTQELHPLRDSLRLAAWILSGDRLQTEAFLMMQSQSSVHLGPLGLINSTTQPGRNGVAGVNKGKLIYFRHLLMK